MPAYISSVEKLNRMYRVFTEQDNRRLDQGEVDALSAFYGGLRPSSRAKVQDRMIEIYRESAYSSRQKDRFLHQLDRVGLSVELLEGVPQDTAGFLRLSKEAQSKKIRELENRWGANLAKAITPSAVPADVRATIEATVAKELKARFGEEDADTFFGDRAWQGVFLSEGPLGNGVGLAGYAVLQAVDDDSATVDRMYFFNARGDYLGDSYRGE